jgi:hypothetical protein
LREILGNVLLKELYDGERFECGGSKKKLSASNVLADFHEKSY